MDIRAIVENIPNMIASLYESIYVINKNDNKFYDIKYTGEELRISSPLDYDKIKGILLLRTAKPGDRFTIDASGHQKKLSRFFIDEKIPRPLREQIPLLCDGEEIIWIIGYRVNPMYYVTEHTKRIVEVTYKESLQE